MAGTVKPEPLVAAMEEYKAIFSSDWKPATLLKYNAEFRDFLAWLQAEKRPSTTTSLDFQTLLAYVAYLKAKPAVRGIWRGDPQAVANLPALPRTQESRAGSFAAQALDSPPHKGRRHRRDVPTPGPKERSG